MPKKSRRKLNIHSQEFREKILQGETEEDKPSLELIHEMHEQLKRLNPKVTLPFRFIAVLAENAANLLQMEYVARKEDSDNNHKGDEKLSFMDDEDVEHLETALEFLSIAMVQMTKKLAEIDDTASTGPRKPGLQA